MAALIAVVLRPVRRRRRAPSPSNKMFESKQFQKSSDDAHMVQLEGIPQKCHNCTYRAGKSLGLPGKTQVPTHADPAQKYEEHDFTQIANAAGRRLKASAPKLPGKLTSSAASTDLPLLPALDETCMVGTSSGQSPSGLESTPGSKGRDAW